MISYIEIGHRNSELSHGKWWSFHTYCTCLPDGSLYMFAAGNLCCKETAHFAEETLSEPGEVTNAEGNSANTCLPRERSYSSGFPELMGWNMAWSCGDARVDHIRSCIRLGLHKQCGHLKENKQIVWSNGSIWTREATAADSIPEKKLHRSWAAQLVILGSQSRIH